MNQVFDALAHSHRICKALPAGSNNAASKVWRWNRPGGYWIPVFELLESRGFDVKLVEPGKLKLVEPGKLKSVPGRKTDVLDCQWIEQLHTYGLLAGSFRPDSAICVLRSYMRQRSTLVANASEHIQRMQKAMMEMNVQRHHVIADITGTTGLAILDAIVAGNRDPDKLAKLRDPRCKNDESTIAKALQGNWREEHLFALKQALELDRFYGTKLSELDVKLEEHLHTFEDRSEATRLSKLKPPKAGSRTQTGKDRRRNAEIWERVC